MARDKFKIRFPLLAPERCEWADMEKTLQDIKYSQNCFVVFAPYDAPAELFFTKLDEDLLISFLVLLGQHDELYKFLKSALVCHEKLCKSGKNGMAVIQRAVMFIRDHLEPYTPNDESIYDDR